VDVLKTHALPVQREHFVSRPQQTERFQLFALIVDVGHAMKPTKLAVK
jgi:hypothetical protein